MDKWKEVVTTHAVVVARFGSPMAPPFRELAERFDPGEEPPAWDDLEKTTISVSENETLGRLIDRAAPDLRVTIDPAELEAGASVSELIEGIALHRAGAWPRTATEFALVDADGRASWGHHWLTVQYRDLLHASDVGLVDGDPRRVYLRPCPSGGALGGAEGWQTFLTLLGTLKDVFVAVGVTYSSVQGLKAAERAVRKGSVAVRTRYREWDQRGGSPSDIAATVARYEWTTPTLARLLDLDESSTEAILELFGLEQRSDGRWTLSHNEVARLVRGSVSVAMWAQEDLGPTPAEEIAVAVVRMIEERAERFAESGSVPDPDPGEVNRRVFEGFD